MDTKRSAAKRFLGFSLVGGSVFVIGYAMLWSLVELMRVEPHIAYGIQAIASIELNFILNKVFNWKERKRESVSRQWIKFHVSKIGTVTFDQGFFAVLSWLGINYLVIKVVSTAIMTVVNFLINEYFVFRKQDQINAEVFNVERWPTIGIVIPCRNSQNHIKALVDSLRVACVNYPGKSFIVLAGNTNDETWVPIKDEIGNGKLKIVEISTDTRYRDSNLKRLVGTCAAIKGGAEVVFYTDTKILIPADTLIKGVQVMLREGVDVVGGTYRRFPDQGEWWARVQDEGLITDKPRFGSGKILDPKKSLNMPITACLFMKAAVFPMLESVWPNESSIYLSHEDTLIVLEMLKNGLKIWVTDDVWVYHNHRSDTKALLLKWRRSAISTANMLRADRNNPFARSRAAKVAWILSCFTIIAIAMPASYWLFHLDGLVVTVSSCFLVMVLLGIVNVVRSRDIKGFLYPVGTFLLLSTFVTYFTITLLIGYEDHGQSLQIY